MKVLIYGLGIHGGGLERARYFLLKGCQVRITDTRTRTQLGSGIEFLENLGAEVSVGKLSLEDFVWADLVVKSQSVKLGNRYLSSAKKVINDFSYVLASPELEKTKLIVVTGNKRTIISSEICHMLECCGKKARRCGSMGVSPLSELALLEKGIIPDYLIMEMSVWQLRDTSYFTEGHFPVIEELVISESTELKNLLPAFREEKVRHAICSKEDAKKLNKDFQIKSKNISKIEYWETKLPRGCIKGMNYAYGALRKLGLNDSETVNSLRSFKGIPGRVELVARTENVMYYNDSSATIPEVVDFSISKFADCSIHIICGGGDALRDATPLVDSVSHCASVHLLSGIFTEKCLIPVLKEKGIKFCGPFDSMEDAVQSANSFINLESSGMEVVIFCPGCISFPDLNADKELEFSFAVERNLNK